MRWLVEDSVNNQRVLMNNTRIKKALEGLGTDYLLVKINDNRKLVVLDKDYQITLENSEEVLNDFIKDGKVVVYGTKKLVDIALEMKLNPGTFINERLDFDYLVKYMKDELLNAEFEINYLRNLNPKEEKFFARPNGNTKLFTGKVMTKQELEEWKKDEKLKTKGFEEEKIIISPVKEIKAEYRFFVVQGEIAASSSYVVEGKTNTEKKVPQEVTDYAKKMIQKNPIADAFVIDIAETNEGNKVIEYNNINCSGLYNCEEKEIVRKINEMYK